MTGKDIIWFGKYGKFKLGDAAWSLERVKRDDPAYVAWLLGQPDFAQKNPALAEYFRTGKEDATPKEVENNDTGELLLGSMNDRFRAWWARAYGDRLRTQGPMTYIPYLRVAIEAWKAGQLNMDPQVAALPPHIPAPDLSGVFSKPLPKADPNYDAPADANVPF